tara:strand:- start:1823 stop:2341 length:519 start_codon:yes stop_codon:yes gene_type:complete
MAIAESRLKVDIRESITLNNNKYDSFNSVTLYNISEVAKRIVTLPIGNSGSSSSPEKEIITISGSIGSGTYLEGDVRYMRFTNLSTTNPIILKFQNESADTYSIKVDKGLSYIYSGISGSGVTDSMDAIESSTLDPPISADLINVTAQASGSVDQYASGSVSAEMEIFVAST